jgi:hypothetical protein
LVSAAQRRRIWWLIVISQNFDHVFITTTGL